MKNNNEPQMTEESIRAIFEPMIQLLLKKNADYGGASFDLGSTGNMVHLWDKVRRYRSLTESKREGNFESVKDTLHDIIGYSVIGIHILDLEKQNG